MKKNVIIIDSKGIAQAPAPHQGLIIPTQEQMQILLDRGLLTSDPRVQHENLIHKVALWSAIEETVKQERTIKNYSESSLFDVAAMKHLLL